MRLKRTFTARPRNGQALVKCRHCGAEHELPPSSGDPAGTQQGWKTCVRCRRLCKEAERGQFGGDIRWVWPDGSVVDERDWHKPLRNADCGVRSEEGAR